MLTSCPKRIRLFFTQMGKRYIHVLVLIARVLIFIAGLEKSFGMRNYGIKVYSVFSKRNFKV